MNKQTNKHPSTLAGQCFSGVFTEDCISHRAAKWQYGYADAIMEAPTYWEIFFQDRLHMEIHIEY